MAGFCLSLAEAKANFQQLSGGISASATDMPVLIDHPFDTLSPPGMAASQVSTTHADFDGSTSPLSYHHGSILLG